ncbi:hypothetical protein [Burkholderia pseudomallei]|uniref:hypothetical protein n=1 Tax=Burkholderia pseudomallei TaxID=28450 RepID=UPI001560A51C|nr:hypothetical protein [Burkholderia pseudomallei]
MAECAADIAPEARSCAVVRDRRGEGDSIAAAGRSDGPVGRTKRNKRIKCAKPQTANRKPQTANRKPQTANRKPQTPNPKPQTPNPIKPRTR